MNHTYFDNDLEQRELREQKLEALRGKFKNKSIFKDAQHTTGSLKRHEFQLKKFQEK